jgi:endonuclease/exonuclease/phosphatase family metal-dependent hydrolase
VSEPAVLRVATYNVHGFRAGVPAVAAVVRELAPDVLLLQESGPRRRLRAFAERLGMAAAVDPPSVPRRRIRDAVLARPPARIVSHRLHRFAGTRWWSPRGCLIARVEAPASATWAVSVHLGLVGAERGEHARSLVAIVASLAPPAPVVVGGDLNATTDARAVGTIAARLRITTGSGAGPPTFPAAAPVARIDHLFVSDDLAVVRQATGGAGASRASDHLPVWADLGPAGDARAGEP